jgi:hypothetical protein
LAAIARIGTLAQLNEDESDLDRRDGDDYVVVDFLLFAELEDGRRVETVAVYQEGGPLSGWGPVDGRLVEPRLSRAGVEEMAALMVGPAGRLRVTWEGVTARLRREGLNGSIDELFAAPYRVEIEPRLQEALGS